jgi:hypothetical protein
MRVCSSFLPQDKVSEFAQMSSQQLLKETQRAAGDVNLSAWHQTLIDSGKELRGIQEVRWFLFRFVLSLVLCSLLFVGVFYFRLDCSHLIDYFSTVLVSSQPSFLHYFRFCNLRFASRYFFFSFASFSISAH